MYGMYPPPAPPTMQQMQQCELTDWQPHAQHMHAPFMVSVQSSPVNSHIVMLPVILCVYSVWNRVLYSGD